MHHLILPCLTFLFSVQLQACNLCTLLYCKKCKSTHGCSFWMPRVLEITL